jgi:hypothetical protein
MARNKKDSITKWSIISIFVGLYILTSVVSTIHVIDFFRLSNPNWLAITLAIAFEIGAAASLGAIIILDKTNKTMVWLLFSTITAMQMMGNMFYAYVHLEGFQGWSELFGLIEEDLIFQKRILSIVSGAILPLVALGFIKSLVDYIKPETSNDTKNVNELPISVDHEIVNKYSDETAEVESNEPAIDPELNAEEVFLEETNGDLEGDVKVEVLPEETQTSKINQDFQQVVEENTEPVSDIDKNESQILSNEVEKRIDAGNSISIQEEISPMNSGRIGYSIPSTDIYIDPTKLH